MRGVIQPKRSFFSRLDGLNVFLKLIQQRNEVFAAASTAYGSAFQHPVGFRLTMSFHFHIANFWQMNKISNNINRVFDCTVLTARLLVVCCIRHLAFALALEFGGTTTFRVFSMFFTCFFQIKLRVGKRKAIHFFQKRKFLFVFSRSRNKKLSCFIQKLLCIHQHMIPNKANAAEGFRKQYLLLGCRICAIHNCSI